MTRQLLVDYLPFEVKSKQINESLKENDGKLIVKGVLQRAEAKNQNGRVYPKNILVREAKKYSVTYIKEMHWLGDDLLGTVEVLGTPSGNILKELFKAGIKLGISSRGMGSVETISDGANDTQQVQPDFELIAFDFVSNPSTQGAFMHPMNEGVEPINGRTCGVYCKAEDIINKIIRGE